MICVAEVTKSRRIDFGVGGFWQVRRKEMCMQGFVDEIGIEVAIILKLFFKQKNEAGNLIIE
jgi:hypothetical protein